MTSIVIALLVCVAAAGAVLAVVALPRLREGDRLLTPDGRTNLDDAARRARAIGAGRGPAPRSAEAAQSPAPAPAPADLSAVDVRDPSQRPDRVPRA